MGLSLFGSSANSLWLTYGIGQAIIFAIFSNVSPPHNMVNFGPPAAEICWRVWCTQQISTGFASWLRYCSDVAQRKPTELCTMFGP